MLAISHTLHYWYYRLAARILHSSGRFYIKYLPLTMTFEFGDGNSTTRYRLRKCCQSPLSGLTLHGKLYLCLDMRLSRVVTTISTTKRVAHVYRLVLITQTTTIKWVATIVPICCTRLPGCMNCITCVIYWQFSKLRTQHLLMGHHDHCPMTTDWHDKI